MTIHLPKDLERFVHDAVRAGRYAREDDVVREALIQLQKSMPEEPKVTDQSTRSAQPTRSRKPLSKDEFHRHLIEIGLMSQLPNTAADFEDPADQPIEIQGEPLSETVIRERR